MEEKTLDVQICNVQDLILTSLKEEEVIRKDKSDTAASFRKQLAIVKDTRVKRLKELDQLELLRSETSGEVTMIELDTDDVPVALIAE